MSCERLEIASIKKKRNKEKEKKRQTFFGCGTRLRLETVFEPRRLGSTCAGDDVEWTDEDSECMGVYPPCQGTVRGDVDVVLAAKADEALLSPIRMNLNLTHAHGMAGVGHDVADCVTGSALVFIHAHISRMLNRAILDCVVDEKTQTIKYFLSPPGRRSERCAENIDRQKDTKSWNSVDPWL